jgi:hypothetical protein
MRLVGVGLTAIATIGATGLIDTAQASVTYTYTAPLLNDFPTGNTTTLSIDFTTAAPLSPSTVYTAPPADTLASAMTVSSTYALGNFTLPLQIFEVNTNSTGAIAAWYIWTDVNTLVGTPPTMTGRDTGAYTINSLSVAVPIPQGVTGRYDYEQATVTDFYASCAGVPGCVLAGDGQPYVGRFSAITNPSLGAWTSTTSVPEPPSTILIAAGFAAVAGCAALRRATNLPT